LNAFDMPGIKTHLPSPRRSGAQASVIATGIG
jgi:hypothetical protein